MASGWWLVYGYLFSAAGLAAWLLSPPLIRLALRVGFVDRPGHRKIHDRPRALLGGVAVFGAFWGVVGLHWLGGVIVGHAAPEVVPELVRPHLAGMRAVGGTLGWLGVASTFILATGLRDDRQALSPRAKLAAQLVTAALLYAGGVRISLFLPWPVAQAALTLAWLVGVVNAINFFDNMDGLCSGVGAICSFLFGLVAALQGQYFIALLAFPLSGALAGFLPFNRHPAQAFLGDAGSLFVGLMLGAIAVLETFYQEGSTTALPVLAPLIILAMPLHDMLATIWLRVRLRRPVYEGDTNHISHRLVRLGLTHPQAVGLICCLTAALGLGAAVLVWARGPAAWLVLGQTVTVLTAVFLLQDWALKIGSGRGGGDVPGG